MDAQKSSRDGQRKDHIRYQDASEQEQANAGSQNKAGVEARGFAHRPPAKPVRDPAKQNSGEADRQARSPIMHSEDLV